MAYTFPPANPGDRFLVTFEGEANGQLILNTFWYRLSSEVTPVHKGEACDEIQSELSNAGGLIDDFIACMPGQYTLNNVWVQPIDPVRYVKSIYPKGTIGGSGIVGETPNIAGVITRRGSAATKKALGSLHLLLPTAVTVMNDGLIEAAHKTKMNTLADEMEKNLTPANNNIYVPCLRNGPLPSEYHDIGECFAQDTVRVMRRRTVRVGV